MTRRQRRTGIALAASLGLVGLGIAVGTGASASAVPTPAAHPRAAHVWVTTPDRTQLLSDDGPVPFSGAAAGQQVQVNEKHTYQTITGFGAAITDSSAVDLYRLDPRTRSRLMAELFDPRHGEGLSFLRQPIGASDFVDGKDYTFDDLPAGQTDYAMRHFSVAHDQRQILPLLRQAKRLNPQLSVVASPWSPPAWMKTNDSVVGGKLIDDPRIYRAYALYFVKFIEAYQRSGVPVDFVTLQNEPQNREPAGYPGMDFPVAQEVRLIDTLGPMLRAAHLRTKILSYDHNWTEHPNDIDTAKKLGEDPEVNYPYDVLHSDAAKWVAGTAYHCYNGDPTAQTALHNAFPQKDIYFTECSGSGSTDLAATFSGTLEWHTQHLIIGNLRNWAKSMINWNLALDDNFGPHLGGCGTCTGVVTVNSDGSIYRNAEYYTLGHLARFVRPGAVRIASTTGGDTGVQTVAFRNPDRSVALIAWNADQTAAQTLSVHDDGAAFAYQLPAGAVATFTWTAAHH